MANIKSCLFDLDGVIVDTAKYHFQAWKRLCEELGFELTEETNEKLKGISRAESLDILLEKGRVKLSDSKKALYMEKKNEWYLEYVDTMGQEEILPGVLAFLKAVRDSDRKVALGSASKNSMLILEKLDILDFFDAVIDGTKVSRGKPDPQTFTLGAEATRTHPCNCVVFEDAQAGVEAGIGAGMYTIGIGKADTLHRANIVIPGFEGVGLEIFERL